MSLETRVITVYVLPFYHVNPVLGDLVYWAAFLLFSLYL